LAGCHLNADAAAGGLAADTDYNARRAKQGFE